MAAASIPSTSGIKPTPSKNKEDDNSRPPTIEELLIQVENRLYKCPEHRASLIIAVWSCLGSGIGYFRNIEKAFSMLYRESALMIFEGHWPKMNIIYKRGLARALTQYSNTMSIYIKGSEGLCSALVMAVFDPWGDPVIQALVTQGEVEPDLVKEFVTSEPHELLLIRIECLVKSHCEEAAIRLLQHCLQNLPSCPSEDECGDVENWRLKFKEWLLRLLFRKRRLNDLVKEASSCSCHDGVRLIHQTYQSDFEDTDPLTETLINLFLVRDLLFQSSYCCTAELMKLWCDFQAKKQSTASDIQEAACKLFVGHASCSAQFYLFVDILYGTYGDSLLPLYLEMYIRGLTSDLNFLEAARQADNKEYIIEIENHMAAMYFKLFTLFNSINKEIAFECLMSAFSLDPTKERLECIKKLSLQISKEKALKAQCREDSKHKACNRSGCPHNCVHTPPLKRKAVVMCDQAIQVGDDLPGFEGPCLDVIKDLNQESCDVTQILCDKPDAKTNDSKDVEDVSATKENSVNMETDSNAQVSTATDEADVKVCVNEENGVEMSHSVNNGVALVNDTAYQETGAKLKSNSEILDSVEGCNSLGNSVPTVSSGHNHISENCKVELSSDTDKEMLPFETYKKNNLISQNECHTFSEKKTSSAIDVDQKESSASDKAKKILIQDEHLKAPLNAFEKDEILSHSNAKEKTNICLNGYKESEKLSNEEDKCSLNVNDGQTNSDKPLSEVEEPHPENISSANQIIVNDSENEAKQLANLPLQRSSSPIAEIPKVNPSNEVNPVITEPRVTRRSEALKNMNLYTFSHVVLDSKILGLPSEKIADFVIVLESLRNRQLKSSCKWSQIKHLCEDYLENITSLRCSMLNAQLSGSVDSEADSISDMTADGFKNFDFHQSNDSVVEDPYVNKGHVLRRFMNSDKGVDMATYVNLSDIHCPQIPLEKLFYTDRSSSHGGHKKKHKRHRNHDKSADKLVLKKFRHGSRVEHDLAKRKKRKRRKAKKGKGHAKKHCFTHGKVTKAYVKNKKKKHKLKKKKDGNSGFISGDYCSDFSSEQLMQLVKEHSNSYSKMPASTSKHPHTSALVARSASSSELSAEPTRKKRKVSFSKKRGHSNKHRDKHKHIKSKSSKRKKTIVVETCGAGFKNVMNDNPIEGNLESVKDYSHIVQYSSVKKMEAVQIRQRSVALNLSNVTNKPQNQVPSTNPCEQGPQLQEFVHQKFESYSPDDIMKMQMLIAGQQAGSSMSNAVSAANNQSILKYFSAKTTSHLLSLAQANNSVGSDSETSKSPIPTFTGQASNSQKYTTVHQQPSNLPSNVKHLIIGANAPYKLANTSSSIAGSSLIPVSYTGNTITDVHNYTGTICSNAKNTSSIVSPHVTTFTIPVAHNPLGGRLVGNKLVIPLPPCGHGGKTTATTMALVPATTTTYATLSGNQPNVIIVKSGNSTQIIHQASSSHPVLANTKLLPITKNRPANPLVTKTVPKIIKQPSKKLTPPVIKRNQVFSATGTNGPSDSIVKKIADSSGKTSHTIDAPKLDVSKMRIEPTPESLLVQRAIEEAKRAIAESATEHSSDLKRTSKAKKESLVENKLLVASKIEEPKATATSRLEEQELGISNVDDHVNNVIIELDKEEPSLQTSVKSPESIMIKSSEKSAISDKMEVSEAFITNDMAIDNVLPLIKPPIIDEISTKTDRPNLTDSNTMETVDLNIVSKAEIKPTSADEQTITVETVLEQNLPCPKITENDNLKKALIATTTSLNENILFSNSEASTATVKTISVEENGVLQVIKDQDVSTSVTPKSEMSISTANVMCQQKELPDKQDEELVELQKKLDEEQKELQMKLEEERKKLEKEQLELQKRLKETQQELLNKPVAEQEKLEKISDEKQAELENEQNIEQEELQKKSMQEQKEFQNKTDEDLQKNASKQNELQPINAENSSPAMKVCGKTESGALVSEVQTRSFTSISDAVRFSLMDMDDGTDSVENQVLQAFRVSHESAPNSPSYDNNSSNDDEASDGSSAVILTTPQTTSTTELSLSRVSQRFEASAHSSQPEKFSDCQSVVSHVTSWNLDDSSLNDTSQALGIQKSPDIDSSGELKDDERPKKKKKRRDRSDRDPESAHKFWCEICHKGFFSAYNLRRHCRNVHKMDLPKGSSDLPFGPKASSELSFANNSQCHQQGENSSSEIVSSPRLTFAQQSCVSPKGAEFLLQSPTHETKNQDFSMKVSSNQHASQMQSSDFQMQTPPRMANQSSSTHVSPVTQSKDFRLPASTTPSQVQLSPSKNSASKSATSPKFQRLPTSCSTPTIPQLTKVSQQISQISLCGQSTLQQQMQLSQLQTSALMQPMSTVACQAQQLQAAQCAHFQANKQITQQGIGQLQLMHHAGQLPAVQHTTHVIPKQTQVQQYKKCNATQQPSKMTESEQLQQAAQLAQTQQILANQHLQKLMHLRQNAIAASGTTPQLTLGTGVQGSPTKTPAQCFQAQLAAARQVAAAAATQLPVQQRSQGTGYTLTHNSSTHQFFSPGQSNQDQSNCPHTFTTQNVVEFSTGGPSYPTIRLSSETNDGLEDLEQFLLENMPWSGEQAVPHGLAQQTGNRPSSADSLTLVIPTSSSQNRSGSQLKSKSPISRPKPRKPTVVPCSKNLPGNLGRGVKKKTSSKKTSKISDSDCSGTKSDVFSQTSLINQQAGHGMDLLQRQCSKGNSSELLSSKSTKNVAISSVAETDSSDSVQCINVTVNPHPKICTGINFSTFSAAEKNMSSFCGTDQGSSRLYDEHNKNSFLDQRNLVSKNCSNLSDNTNTSLCDTDPLHAGSPFAYSAKESMPNSRTAFCQNEAPPMCPNRSEISQAVFLGQRNIENCDMRTNMQRSNVFDNHSSSNLHCGQIPSSGLASNASTSDCARTSVSDIHNLFLGGKTASNNDSAVSVKINNIAVNLETDDPVDKISINRAKRCESLLPSTKVNVEKKGVVFTDVSVDCDSNFNLSIDSKFNDSDSTKKVQQNGDNLKNNIKTNFESQELTIPVTDASNKDINFNDVPSKDTVTNSSDIVSEPNGLFNNANGDLVKTLFETDSRVSLRNKNLEQSKIVNGWESIENAFNSCDVADLKIGKKNINQLVPLSLENDTDIKAADLKGCDKELRIPNYNKSDDYSSQENKVPSSVNHVSELIYSTENEKPDGIKRIALRIHKSQEIPINTNSKYYMGEKPQNDIKPAKKSSHKKKSNAKQNHDAVENCTKKTPPLKLDVNSNLQNIRLSHNDENEALCKVVPHCRKSGSNETLEEVQENGVCIESKLVTPPEQISPGRLRLRDTPKTSVKRLCPCCVDTGTPKKCRSNVNKNVVKLFGPTVQSNKTKRTLKTKNVQNTKNTKTNTRSSKRLRSRNNAIS